MVFKYALDPVLVDLGPVEIRYYGLFYVVGLIITYFLLCKLTKERSLNLNKDDIMDFLVYLAVGLLIGGRIGYFLFYNFNILLSNPLELVMLQHGGMSFHGGLIGIIGAAMIYSRKKKCAFYDLADIAVLPASLGLALGRIGNFINGELYGRVTSSNFFLAFDFGDGLPRHPSQLYESFKNLLNFAILWNVRLKSLPKGVLFWLFIFNYGWMRFLIEFVREPDAQLGFVVWNTFTMGQVLTSIMVVASGCMIMYLYRKHHPQP